MTKWNAPRKAALRADLFDILQLENSRRGENLGETGRVHLEVSAVQEVEEASETEPPCVEQTDRASVWRAGEVPGTPG